jgi:outer membrane protein insertion porin family
MDAEPWTDANGDRQYYEQDDITRSSIGAVLEWNSGFGPINLVFGYALDDEPGDETSAFEFSMGSKF